MSYALSMLGWSVIGLILSASLVLFVRRHRPLEHGEPMLANALTMLRLALIAPTVWLLAHHRYLSATISYLMLGATDVLDGIVARRTGRTTRFGILMDPLADVLSTFAVFTVFVIDGFIPRWLYLILLVRYAMLGVGSLWLTRAFGPIAYRSTIPGKIVGVLQAGIAVWIMWQAAHRGAGAASNGPLFAFLALGFVSIVISQAVIGYRHARAGARKRLNGGSPG